MKMQHFLGLSGLALLILLPPLGWAQTRTFHTPGGNITPGSEGQGSQNAPRGQNIRPASESGSTSAGSTTGSSSSRTLHTPGGNITPGSEGQGSQNAPRGQNIRPASEGGSTSAGSTTGASRSPSTITTPGGGITPSSQGTNQNIRGQAISPAGSTAVGTSRGSSTITTPAGSMTSKSQGSQNVRQGTTVRFPEYIGERREPRPTTTPTKGTSRIGPGISTTPGERTTIDYKYQTTPQRTPSGQSDQNVRQGTTIRFPQYIGESREGSPVTTPTKGTSRIGPGISTTPGERTTIDYKYKATPQRTPSGQSGQNVRQGTTIRFEGEYVGEHRQPRSTEVRSSTKGTSRVGPGISTSPAGRQTINVGGPQGVTGTSPKTGVTVGAPVGTFKSGIEVPSFGGPKAGSQQAMPVGGGPGMSPGMQAPTAPGGVSVPVEAPPPIQKVPSIDVP